MNEWTKLALSALLGLSAGLLLEPLKITIANRAKISLLKGGLYSNLAFVSGKCNWRLVNNLRRSKTKVIYDEYFGEISYVDRATTELEALDEVARIDLGVFRYYYDQEKPIFWRLNFASRLKDIYSELATAVSVDGEHGVRLTAIENVNTKIREYLEDGTLDRTLFFKFLRKYFGEDYVSAYSQILGK